MSGQFVRHCKIMMNSTVKKTGWILLFAAAMVGTTASAQSRYFDGAGGSGFQSQDNRGAQRSGNNGDQRQGANRNERDDRGGAQRRNDRMSPDERRALRQQIDEAGRDIYRRR